MRQYQDGVFLYVLFLVTTITYIQVFNVGWFNYDDLELITNNEILKFSFYEMLTTVFTQNYYRDYLPLTLMSLWFDVKFFGINPVATHSINFILHLLNIYLVFYFLKQLSLLRSWRYIICFVFAVHPVQTEVLMWASNRNSLLAGVFIWLALVFHAKYLLNFEVKNKNLILSGLFYLVSLLCKSVGILLPFYFMLIECLTQKTTINELIKKYSGFIIISVLFFIVRIRAFDQITLSKLFDGERLLHLPVVVLNLIGLYVKALLYPIGYSIIYPPYTFNFLSVFTVLLVILLLGCVYYVWRKTRDKTYLIFIGFVSCFLLPVLQLLPRSNYINDRYLYIPIVGFTVLFLMLIRDIAPRWKYGLATARCVGIVFLLSLPFFSYSYSRIWKSDMTLWERVVEVYPLSRQARNNLANAYIDELRFDEAVEHLKIAMTLNDSPIVVQNTFGILANVHSVTQSGGYYNPKLGIKYLYEGLRLSSNLEHTFIFRHNLALLYLKLGDTFTAYELLTRLHSDIKKHVIIDKSKLKLLWQTEGLLIESQPRN
ncbi:MAG: hypothetical protein SGI74_05375 [Oligoflexia bacterium]|nr:hypothetical protein [Oligoflexia bacterium]